MANDPKQFVPSGTKLKCSYCPASGNSPVVLKGGNSKVTIYGEPMMTELDITVSGVFTVCNSPKNVLRKPCTPVMVGSWMDTADPIITSNKVKLLVNDSYNTCFTFGGEINPIMDDPVDITVPKKDDEGKDLPTVENPIDALKEKMNGAVASIKAKVGEIQEKFGTDLQEMLNEVTGPLGKLLNKPGVKSAVKDLQELVGKAQKYKSKADEIVNVPEAAKGKISNKILGTETEEETEEEEDENKSLQERINDGIGGISAEIEAFKQETEDDENFVIEGFNDIIGNMKESLSEFRTYFTETFMPSNDQKPTTEESDNKDENESTTDKIKEEYEDIKEYREEYKKYKEAAKGKFKKYTARLKEMGYDLSNDNKGDIIKAFMLVDWLNDKNKEPIQQGISTSGSSTSSEESKPKEEKEKTTKKNPNKVRTQLNAEVTGYIDHKLLESGVTEDIKEAKEDLADVQKDINRAKKYLTISSNFNDSVKVLKDSIMGKIGADFKEKYKGKIDKATKKQAYITNKMNLGSSALELSKFALSGFATSPGSVITKVDDDRGKDTDDDPNSDDFGNISPDINYGGALGTTVAGSDSGVNDTKDSDKEYVLRAYWGDIVDA